MNVILFIGRYVLISLKLIYPPKYKGGYIFSESKVIILILAINSA